MRVAMVSPYSLSVPGGVQGQVAGLAAALVSAGVDVDVLAPSGPGRATATVRGVRWVDLGRAASVAVNGSQAPVSPFPWTAARAVRRLRGGRYDVVHLHEPFVPGPTLAALGAGPRPLVGTFHRAGSDVAYRSLGRVAGALTGRLSALVAVSPAARETAAAVLRAAPDRFELLWNGVDLDAYRPAPAASGESRPAVLFAGRHEPRKGLAVLLEAAATMPTDLELWVCGAGPATADLRARYQGDERIRWLGRLGDAELAGRMAAATIFCSPALGGESFGLVLAEAMAAGTAVVASDIDGYREALAGAGVLVRPGDAAALGRALSDLLDDPARRGTLVAAGRTRARALSLTDLAARYLDIYQALVTHG